MPKASLALGFLILASFPASADRARTPRAPGGATCREIVQEIVRGTLSPEWLPAASRASKRAATKMIKKIAETGCKSVEVSKAALSGELQRPAFTNCLKVLFRHTSGDSANMAQVPGYCARPEALLAAQDPTFAGCMATSERLGFFTHGESVFMMALMPSACGDARTRSARAHPAYLTCFDVENEILKEKSAGMYRYVAADICDANPGYLVCTSNLVGPASKGPASGISPRERYEENYKACKLIGSLAKGVATGMSETAEAFPSLSWVTGWTQKRVVDAPSPAEEGGEGSGSHSAR